MFVHQDGVLLCPTIWALSELGILERSLGGDLPVSELFPDVTDTGFGYMRVGLRCMASQGWIVVLMTGPPTNQTDYAAASQNCGQSRG